MDTPLIHRAGIPLYFRGYDFIFQNTTLFWLDTCALVAQANAIVSGDADLLALKSYQGIPIFTAAQAVDNIKDKT